MNLTSSQDLLAGVLERNQSLFTIPSGAVAETDRVETNLLDCIEASMTNVFRTMCNIEFVLERQFEGCCIDQRYGASGIITLSGDIQSTIALRFPTDLAFACSNALLGMQPTALDENVTDVVAEMANMVAGGAKERLQNSNLTLGLPFVVTGAGHHVSFSAGMRISTMRFHSPQGHCIVEVGVAPDSPQ